YSARSNKTLPPLWTSFALPFTQFDPNSSSSFNWVDETPVDLDFGEWGSLTAKVGNDTFFKDFQHAGANMDFYLGIEYRGLQWAELIQDGFIACGPTHEGSTSGLLFKTLWDAGRLSEPVISFNCDYTVDGYLTDSGEVRFGGTDTTAYDPQTVVSFPQNQSSPFNAYWVSDCRDMKVNGVSITGSYEALLDTGAGTIKGDPAKIQALVAAITLDGALPISPDNPDNYNYPDLVIEMGTFDADGSEASFALTPREYFQYIEAEVGIGTWYLGLEELDGFDGGINIGAIFFNSYYSMWEYDTSTSNLQGNAVKVAQKIGSKKRISRILKSKKTSD
ncbi:MAG: hypothetical protein HRU28_03240, partial [Rhizobiales bacterium]|nr:hypothetical protein [Hyphomicrobiales bacterium]